MTNVFSLRVPQPKCQPATRRPALLAVASLLGWALGCGAPASPQPPTEASRTNPFLEDQRNHSKEDSAYQNPEGTEVEVDLEGNIEAAASDLARAPGALAQYAQTYLRTRREFYLQSLSDSANTPSRIEWLVDGTWVSASDARTIDSAKLSHFRIRGINAVLLHDLGRTAELGATYSATVPLRPFSLYQEVGAACADKNSHLTLDQNVYWYLWNPSNGCNAQLQELTLRISKLSPTTATTYPEYDLLTEDGVVTAVMLFGQVETGQLEESDPGLVHFGNVAKWLKEAAFEEISEAPVGRRFRKHLGKVDFEVDLYSPEDFAGLNDHANLLNFDTAVTDHEIVIYTGHSLLGASDLWGSQRYPDRYQIFFQGGCLSYEYYVSPLLKAKGGWGLLDVVSSVVPVPVEAEPGAAFLAKLAWSLEHGYAAAWVDLLGAVRTEVGSSAFGVSGVRNNCFSPSGSSCSGRTYAPTSDRYEVTTPVAIPDGDEVGISSSVQVPDALVAKSVSVELSLSHEFLSDVTLTLEHNDHKVVLWDQESEGEVLHKGFAVESFANQQVQGTWTLWAVDHAKLYCGQVDRWALLVKR